MTIDQLLLVVRRRALALILCIASGLAGAVYYLQSTASTYESSVRVFVNSPTRGGIDQTVTGVQLSLALLQSYARIATSHTTEEAVREQLKLPPSAPLGGTFSSSVEPNTLLLGITASSKDPGRARVLADAAAIAFDKVIQGLATDPASKATIRVIDPATTPTTPSSPARKRTLALGLILGLLSGVGLAAGLEALDRSIHTVLEGRSVLGVPGLSVIPSRRRRDTPRQIVAGATDPMAEPYRALRTAIRLPTQGLPMKTLLVTSPQASEGKTSIASNLALLLAQSGEHVCLVDADLRRSSIPKVFNIAATPGLTSVVLGDATLEESLSVVDGLEIMPAGEPHPSPSELLGSEAFAQFLDQLKLRYDIIVIDAPPILPVTDAVVLSAQVDAVLLVIRNGKTKQSEAAKARELLGVVSARTVGFVLNRANRRAPSYGYDSYSNLPRIGGRVR